MFWNPHFEENCQRYSKRAVSIKWVSAHHRDHKGQFQQMTGALKTYSGLLFRLRGDVQVPSVSDCLTQIAGVFVRVAAQLLPVCLACLCRRQWAVDAVLCRGCSFVLHPGCAESAVGLRLFCDCGALTGHVGHKPVKRTRAPPSLRTLRCVTQRHTLAGLQQTRATAHVGSLTCI